MRRRDPGRSDAFADRLRREDEAPRLRDAVKRLVSLRLHLRDLRPEGADTALGYVKPIVVATAPAHFEVPCFDKQCDGRHDLTDSLMKALRASQKVCSGESQCPGMAGDVPCDRTLAYRAEAAYSR